MNSSDNPRRKIALRLTTFLQTKGASPLLRNVYRFSALFVISRSYLFRLKRPSFHSHAKKPPIAETAAMVTPAHSAEIDSKSIVPSLRDRARKEV